jgi:hypothetical protein
MKYYAKVLGGEVINVIVSEDDFMDTFVDDSPGEWYEVWKDANGSSDKRYNMPGVGYTYDSIRDAFIAPKRYDSWVLNETTCSWEAPVSVPEGSDLFSHRWNEETQSWDAVETE